MLFKTKQTHLIKKTSKGGNAFTEKAKTSSAKIILSENGAIKLSTTGNPFLDQFSQAGKYKQPRTFDEISKDQEALWNIHQLLSVAFIFYLRMITRVIQLFTGVKTQTVQKGQGLKHEAIFRMIWLHLNAPNVFWKNIGLFVSVGSWKDIFTMLSYDLQWHGWNNRKLDWDAFGQLILTGLENPNTCELIKKYLPQIKSNNKCTTLEAQADNIIAKWLCYLMFNSKEEEYKHYKNYRKLKSSGTAHQWQQLISQRKFDRIDFGTIHGRALTLLVKSKFLKNQGLSEKYSQWIVKPEVKEKIKSTSFVHELFKGLANDGMTKFYNGEHRGTMTFKNTEKHVFDTIDAQFLKTVNQVKEEGNYTKWIVVRDTSGSMAQKASGTGMSCYAIAKALSLYFSYLIDGPFQHQWIEFNKEAKMHDWKGNTPCEKWFNDTSDVVGNTDFISVIDLFIHVKRQGVDESDFPEGIICISDGEFDPARDLSLANVENAKIMLSHHFSPEYVQNFKIILWNIERGIKPAKFEPNIPNVFYFGGYDGAVITMMNSRMKSAEEVFNATMNQEILQMIEI